jgi:hypothetical protein
MMFVKVLPILLYLSNYISVLPIISKIYEKVLYARLDKFLVAKNFISQKQYGFRPKSSTLSATIDLVTQIKLKIDQKQIVLGVFIDLRKAFDTVSHQILLEKLRNIGIVDKAHDIFKSYLENRQQVVKINDHQSGPKLVTYGVPQGSILGPLLFLVYINSIQDIGLKGDLILYADDTSLFYYSKSIHDIIINVQTDLDLLSNWFNSNLLTINIDKTNYVIFSAKNKKIPDFTQPSINGQVINRKEHEKYLGLIFDAHLTWKLHIEKAKAKLTSLTGALRNISRCFPRRVKFLIYNALVKPHIDYLIEVWGTAAKTNLNKLQRAQNKLIKVLFNYNFLTSTDKIYNDTKIMTVTQTYVYYTCLLIRKILSKGIQTQISFSKNHQFQRMKLRNADNLVLRAPRTNYGNKSLVFEGAKLYNNLPKDIKDCKSMFSFKKYLKFHIKNKK